MGIQHVTVNFPNSYILRQRQIYTIYVSKLTTKFIEPLSRENVIKRLEGISFAFEGSRAIHER